MARIADFKFLLHDVRAEPTVFHRTARARNEGRTPGDWIALLPPAKQGGESPLAITLELPAKLEVEGRPHVGLRRGAEVRVSSA